MKDIIFSIFPLNLILGSFKNDCKSLIISILSPHPHTCYKYILIHINISVGIYFLVPTILGLFRKGIHSLELAQSLMLSLFCSGELGSGLRQSHNALLLSSCSSSPYLMTQMGLDRIFCSEYSNYCTARHHSLCLIYCISSQFDNKRQFLLLPKNYN